MQRELLRGVKHLCTTQVEHRLSCISLIAILHWQTGLRQICKGLKNELCSITAFDLHDCLMADEFVVAIAESLPLTNVNEQSMKGDKISDASVVSQGQALQTKTGKVTTLHLSGNHITDAGVLSLCQALQALLCQVITLNLRVSQIIDARAVSLCQTLQAPSYQVTTLDLSGNQITDAGVVSLRQASQTPSYQVNTLDLTNFFRLGFFSLSRLSETFHKRYFCTNETNERRFQWMFAWNKHAKSRQEINQEV